MGYPPTHVHRMCDHWAGEIDSPEGKACAVKMREFNSEEHTSNQLCVAHL